ncbi:hypothetical protein AVEN_74460-1 [Araneus ventricosus]|uniref:Uncharacterized protein n=1 Tax=Araneus ventricosus TaxID=182803 RepID=A0A4Y2TYT5_ARAVE|nr:hypothetical protein AVEN_74460-1 [Araneus ventricosus]
MSPLCTGHNSRSDLENVGEFSCGPPGWTFSVQIVQLVFIIEILEASPYAGSSEKTDTGIYQASKQKILRSERRRPGTEKATTPHGSLLFSGLDRNDFFLLRFHASFL